MQQGKAWRRTLKRITGTWLSADPRALGIFRIAFGLLAIADVLRRIPYTQLFYSAQGVIPSHWVLYTQGARPQFSLMFAFNRPGEIYAFFGLTLVSLILFTIGWRTRLFHVISAVLMWSIHSRISIIENGGDVVMNLWWLWTLALPLGRRLSVDALLADLRARPDAHAGALNARATPSRDPVWSLSVLAILLQLSVIYFFNTVHKDGTTWKNGTALAWVFEQDRIITGLGLWARDTWPLWLTKGLSWGTLVIEGLAPILLFTPLFTVWARRVLFTGLVSLHTGIWLLTDVGYFSPTMMVSYLIFLSARDIEGLKRILGRFAAKPTVLHYDSDCGVCTLTVRILARFDRLERLTFYGREPDAPMPPGLLAEHFHAEREHTIIAWRPGSERIYRRHEAIGAAVAALPLGYLFAWLFFVPGLGAALGWGYDRFAARRHLVSAWIGMGECGFGPPPEQPAQVEAAPIWRSFARWGQWGAQGLIAFALVCTGSQVMIENAWVRKRIEHKQPDWARDFIGYGRFFQGWSMFAPDAPTQDGTLIIEALLEDGRILDPQTGKPPVFGPADARIMAWDQFWGSYSWRVASRQHARMRTFLKDWLLAPGPHLKLKASERIVGVRVWWIDDRSPDPRKKGAQAVETGRYIVVEGGRRLPKVPE